MSSPRSTPRTADRFVAACRSARAAQRDWAAVPAPVRGRVIAQVGRLVEANKEALAALVTREIGKPLRGVARRGAGDHRHLRLLPRGGPPALRPDSAQRDAGQAAVHVPQPVGVAAIVTAGNFPVAVPSWYLVPALLCGNAVVWKPAEYAAAVRRSARRALLAGRHPANVLAPGARRRPDHVRRTVRRARSPAGRQGRLHRLDQVGRRIGELPDGTCRRLPGARRQEPIVVTADADLELAVEGALFSGFGTAGQRCTSLGTVFVHESCTTSSWPVWPRLSRRRRSETRQATYSSGR